MDYTTHRYELFREDIQWLRSKAAPELPKTFGSTYIHDEYADPYVCPAEVFKDRGLRPVCRI